MAIVVVFAPVGVPLAEAFELEEALPPLEPVLKNHSVSFRNCCEVFCDSWANRWFSSRSLTIVSFRASFSSDSFRTDGKKSIS